MRKWKKWCVLTILAPTLFMGQCFMEIRTAAITATADYVNTLLGEVFQALPTFDQLTSSEGT